MDSASVSLPRARGVVEIGFGRRAGATRLTHLFQDGCGKARLPNVAPDDPPEAVLINSSGGLTDGDSLRFAIEVGGHAHALVTTQAAEKVYRSRGMPARVTTSLSVADGGYLEWLPQETILFNHARLHRSTTIDLRGNARFLGCEALVFGRAAHGETMVEGAIRDEWRLSRDGRLLWTDPFRIEGAVQATLDRPAVAAGARAVALVAYAGPQAGQLLEPLRAVLDVLPIRAGTSQRGEVLLTRLLADTGLELRRAMGAILACLRQGITGTHRPMPRVWAC